MRAQQSQKPVLPAKHGLLMGETAASGCRAWSAARLEAALLCIARHKSLAAAARMAARCEAVATPAVGAAARGTVAPARLAAEAFVAATAESGVALILEAPRPWRTRVAIVEPAGTCVPTAGGTAMAR